jgi:hypothetical protein
VQALVEWAAEHRLKLASKRASLLGLEVIVVSLSIFPDFDDR